MLCWLRCFSSPPPFFSPFFFSLSLFLFLSFSLSFSFPYSLSFATLHRPSSFEAGRRRRHTPGMHFGFTSCCARRMRARYGGCNPPGYLAPEVLPCSIETGSISSSRPVYELSIGHLQSSRQSFHSCVLHCASWIQDGECRALAPVHCKRYQTQVN